MLFPYLFLMCLPVIASDFTDGKGKAVQKCSNDRVLWKTEDKKCQEENKGFHCLEAVDSGVRYVRMCAVPILIHKVFRKYTIRAEHFITGCEVNGESVSGKKNTIKMARERKQKDVEVEDNEDEDEQNVGEMQYLQINQSQKQRLKLRRDYRDLLSTLQKDRYDYIRPDSNKLDEALNDTNDLNKQVRMPREGALDAKTVLVISNLGREKAEGVHTDFIKFEPGIFAEKLITYIGGEARRGNVVRVAPQGWVMLGKAVQKFFSKSPAFHYMFGTLDRAEHHIPSKPPGPKQQKDPDNLSDEATVPKLSRTFGESGKSERTSLEVKRIGKILETCYREDNDSPICYFEFVVNPDSFGQTVENIFYVSFLIRDGDAKMTLDKDGLPRIEPVIRSGGEQAREKTKNHQAIVSITPAQWKELVEVYEIEEPLIPTRKQKSRPVMNESPSRSVVPNNSPTSSKSSLGRKS